MQYEGEELSKNIFYTAEAVNQQATPAVDYMLAAGKKKFYLLGSDYVYPQTTNLILLEYLLSKGVPLENIGGGFRKDESRQDHLRRQIHALRPHRLPADRRGDQTVRRRRQRLRHQHPERRHQRSVLQGIRRRRPHRRNLPGRLASPSRKTNSAACPPSNSSASSVAGPTSCRSSRRRTRSSSPTSKPGSQDRRSPASSRKAA